MCLANGRTAHMAWICENPNYSCYLIQVTVAIQGCLVLVNEIHVAALSPHAPIVLMT